jgi:hypothetical protein
MLTFAVSVLIMLAVVGASLQWAVRKQRRQNPSEEAAHARHH